MTSDALTAFAREPDAFTRDILLALHLLQTTLNLLNHYGH